MKKLSDWISYILLCSYSIAGVVATGCGQNPPVTPLVDAAFVYRMDQPDTVYKLPAALTEVSGIRFHDQDGHHIYMEQDENGRLYWLEPGGDKVSDYDFGKDGDYEDLAFLGPEAIFLRSDGDLFRFNFSPAAGGREKPVTGDLHHDKNLVPKGEYEGLYADTASGLLYMLCKECKHEDHNKAVTVYRLEKHKDGWRNGATFMIDVKAVGAAMAALAGSSDKQKKQDLKMNFKPSAICQHPVTGNWYVLSSVNQVLAVLDKDWQVKAVSRLERKLFGQPEGMCFDQAGNLYISNEGQLPGGATLLKFIPQS